jgi:hypothetical protein
MDTRHKLSEAKYFLDKLPNLKDNPDEFYYNLSAFLNAWRSALDIMLYDMAEHFNLGLTRDDEMTNRDFALAARLLQKTDATQFISWWNQKQGLLGNTPLWKKRNIIFHRGRVGILQYSISAPFSGGTSGTISISSNIPVEYDDYPLDFRETLVPGGLRIVPTETATTPNVEYYFDDLPNHTVIDVCRTAYEKMVEIVEEAETQYAVRL